MADGGSEYLRRGAVDLEMIEDLSLDDEAPHEVLREVASWGKNYDADMNLLPETEWVLIKDLTEDHLDALLTYPPIKRSAYLKIFKNEKEFRKCL